MQEEKMVGLLVMVPLELRTRVKIASARRNCTIAKVVADALEAYLQLSPEVAYDK